MLKNVVAAMKAKTDAAKPTAADLQVGRLQQEAHAASQARAQFRAEHTALRAVLADADWSNPHTAFSAVRATLTDQVDAWAHLLAIATQRAQTAAGQRLCTVWRDAGYLPDDAQYQPSGQHPADREAEVRPRAQALVATTTERVIRALQDALDAMNASEKAQSTRMRRHGRYVYVTRPASKATPPAPSTLDVLQAALTAVYEGWYALDEEDAFYDISDDDVSLAAGMSLSRADSIGLDAAGGAWNGGLDDAAGAAASGYGFGVTRTWTTMGDDRVRPTHDDADGQEVSLDENFTVGGEDLMYPGDPSGSMSETQGCRCSVDYSVSLPGDIMLGA